MSTLELPILKENNKQKILINENKEYHMSRKMVTIDGNQACTHVAYATSEIR